MQNSNSQFVFEGYDASLEKGRAGFYYRLAAGKKTYRFSEKISFPVVQKVDEKTQEVAARIFENLLLLLGISYWKTYCPKRLEIIPFTLTKAQAQFWNTVYTKGLGEFYYKNKVDFRGRVQFPSYETRSHRISSETWSHKIKNRSLLLIGGGKDSLLTAEMLKQKQKPFTIFTVNSHPLQRQLAKIIGNDSIAIKRELDPQLFKLNQKHGVYNGHVPVSAIYATLGFLAAVLYNYRYIVASNEKSANFGNVKYLGQMINHQWSKSAEFEKLFQAYVREFITPGIKYYSLLRPYTELEIAEKFSRYPKYFPVFSSCNSNFRLLKSDFNSRVRPYYSRKWCGKCPKCAFTFAALAAYLPKKEVVKIFGKNLLADKALVPVYEELLGLKRHKPFECVGTPEETKRAFRLILRRKEFNNEAVLCALKN